MWRKKHDQNALRKIYKELNGLTQPGDKPRRIELCRKALTLVSRNAQPDEWARLQDDLASSLCQTTTGVQAENIELALGHFKQALEVRTRAGCPLEWASTQINLGTTYRDRILGERAENIELAIDHYQQALQVITHQSDQRHWALIQDNLASTYYERIRGKRAENLEQAIYYAHQALEVYTRQGFPKEWIEGKNILGEVYRVRIVGTRWENIEQAIQHFKEVLAIPDLQWHLPEEWAMTQNNLGNAYLVRIHGRRADNIEQAIDHFRQALTIQTRQAHPKRWAMVQYNLGNAYRIRIHGDQAENIEKSIEHLHQALEVRTRQAFQVDWAQTQNNLGNVYLARILGDQEENIEQAIDHFKQALKVRTPESFPADWAETLNNLGNAYLVRIHGTQAENVNEAINCYKQALEVRTREASPEDWAQTLSNLAGAERMLAGENIEQSIQHLQDVLQVRTRKGFPADWAETQNNLAIAYMDRAEGARAENIEQAIYHYRQALKVYTPTAFPDHCRRTARALGNLAFDEQRWELACNAYDKAFESHDVLVQATFTRESKQAELREAQNLPPRAAYAYVQLGNKERAVEVLEHGRAQLLRESLERYWLEQLPALGFEQLYEEYQQARKEYDALQKGTAENTGSEDWISQTQEALQKLKALITAIRKTAGHRYPQYRLFLKALSFPEIQKQAQARTLAYLTSTSAGGLALVVSKKDVQAVQLSALDQPSLQKQIWSPSDEEIERININLKQGDITSEDIQAVGGGYFSTYALWSLTPHLTKTPEELKQKLAHTWHETLDNTTRWLWDAILGELISVLGEHNQSATLIPAAQLALLPLHAAWIEDSSKPTHRRYALDEINLSYAPSAHALWQADLAAQRPAESLIVVDNPKADDPKRSLVFSKDEVKAALNGFGQSSSEHLHGKDASLKTVKEKMQKAHVLHFSTHGRAGWEKAEQARLELADGNLTLPDIFALDLNQARLAVLSACETGVPGLELIDEMIGLPAGMMQAGVPGVVGSLWAVREMSTALLMSRFYKFWRKEGKPPQEALRQSQIWLRDRSINSPYCSPHYWAAFTYTGV